MHVVLDLSRLILSVRRPVPSGIDRVEMAYAQAFLARPAADCTFAAESLWGWFAAVPRDRIAAFVGELAACWQHGPGAAGALSRARRLAAQIHAGLAAGKGRVGLSRVLARHRRSVFLLVSHRALDRQAPIARLREAGAAFVPLVHDLIPLSHPEYARPAQVRRHALRLATTAALADGILVNSATTAAVLRASLPPGAAPITVAPLGVPAWRSTASAAADLPREPYFLSLGTIEPRKNHLLLLHLWRGLVEAGARPPKLVLVGRRGWENENILDLLDRCPVLRGVVEERGTLPDAAIAPLVAQARALLFPSFAEGFGLPAAEALAAGVPVICSDISAMREVVGGVAELIDPMDGPAWRNAVLDYADPASARRRAQIERLRGWRPPSWDTHFARVDEALDRAVAARSAALPAPGYRTRRARAFPGLPGIGARPAAGFAEIAARPADVFPATGAHPAHVFPATGAHPAHVFPATGAHPAHAFPETGGRRGRGLADVQRPGRPLAEAPQAEPAAALVAADPSSA